MNNASPTQALELLQPDWAAPAAVRSMVTTRLGGVSSGAYHALNLGDHVGDDSETVNANRSILKAYLPSEPFWLKQTHGTVVSTPSARVNAADAIVTNSPNEVLAILTADCLPVLFCSGSGAVIGAAHAGWRGLCHGVLENTVHAMHALMHDTQDSSIKSSTNSIMAWLGPAIGPSVFEVGEDVLDAFQSIGIPFPPEAFIAIDQKPGKYLANIYVLARSRLQAIGVHDIYGGSFCTVTEANRFFSYRREGVTGRFASLIWIESPNLS